MGYPDTGAFDPYTANDASPRMSPGTRFSYQGKEFVYARAEDAAWTAGSVLEWADTTMTEASPDRAGASAISGAPAGVALCAVTDAYYGCILVKGFHSAVRVEAGVAAGDNLMVSATDHTATAVEDIYTAAYSSAGTIEAAFTAASGEYPIGFALSAASSAGTAACVIHL